MIKQNIWNKTASISKAFARVIAQASGVDASKHFPGIINRMVNDLYTAGRSYKQKGLPPPSPDSFLDEWQSLPDATCMPLTRKHKQKIMRLGYEAFKAGYHS